MAAGVAGVAGGVGGADPRQRTLVVKRNFFPYRGAREAARIAGPGIRNHADRSCVAPGPGPCPGPCPDRG
ncbi:hypothetical protein FRACA_610026 [Frankia canadensis]|uniref:Uncharacterized protein n=1 Tax=Frankia canadensis TaxID=1836972 RepID=A0A2I2KZR3_9ACTN|nr:hypothetical protein FRACA_610026 [Frankia canadensis]SOU58435.1 hypothetical protein FRACA_610026 [Frankia canadensis]